MSRIVRIGLILALVLSGCAQTAPGSQPAGASFDSGGPPIQGVRLSRITVSDPQINGIDAYSVLVPDGWRFNGVVEWRHDMANLAAAVIVAEDPQTGDALETYFPVPHAYTEGLLIPIGGNWLGSIVAPPTSAADYLLQLVIPSARPGATLVSSEPMPNVAAEVVATQPAVSGGTLDADAALVRISYDRAGVTFEEDFVVTLVYQSVSGITSWGALQLYSVRAPAGTLDAAEPLLQTLASSIEATPLWSANYQVVFDLFVQGQYQNIQAAGDLSRYLARNADEIADIYRSAYESQQAAYDRIFESFSQYVRGVEPYQVPSVGQVLIPNDREVCHPAGQAAVVLIPLGAACPTGTDRLSPSR